MGQCWKRCKLTDAPMSSKGRRPWTCQMCVTNQAEKLRALSVYRSKFLARLVSSVIYFVGNIYLFYTYTVLKPLSLNLLGVAVQNMKETSVYQVVRRSWLNSASAALQNRREKERDNGEKKCTCRITQLLPTQYLNHRSYDRGGQQLSAITNMWREALGTKLPLAVQPDVYLEPQNSCNRPGWGWLPFLHPLTSYP